MNKPKVEAGAVLDNPLDVSVTNLDQLYTLTYLYNSAIRFTILVFIREHTTVERVTLAKQLCAKRNWKFSWLEPTITVMEE